MYIFGAGNYGREAIQLLKDRCKIEGILDNNRDKAGTEVDGIKVFWCPYLKDKIQDDEIIVAVSGKIKDEILGQLHDDGFQKVTYLGEIRRDLILQNIRERPDHIEQYQNVIKWIFAHTEPGKGIRVINYKEELYPEVTGYFIPTLLQWGYRDLAIQYARWLIRIQKENGAWFDAEDKNPYLFDSAQILKGLIAIRGLLPKAEFAIIRGCDYILSCQEEETGRLVAPTEDAFTDPKTCNELIHLYCLSPLIDAGKIFHRQDYIDQAEAAKKYYIENYKESILNFHLLSHFQAYVMEALLDLGEEELCEMAMKNILKYQREDGSIPGYENVHWVCSTGLFQLALVCFRMGDLEHGEKAFRYMCKFQNPSGGWYGSYVHPDNQDEDNTYFPGEEISWVCKYFLDALYWKNKAEMDSVAHEFKLTYRKDDGRYQVIEHLISEKIGTAGKDILDLGCGKGGYLRNLVPTFPDDHFYGVDISEEVLKYLDQDLTTVEKRIGNLTCVPYSDDSFDLTYTCEALEHAVDIGSAIREMARVTKSGGYIVVIDKNKERLGEMVIGEWEQWFDEKELKNIMSRYCTEVKVEKKVSYEEADYGLFYAWIGKVR